MNHRNHRNHSNPVRPVRLPVELVMEAHGSTRCLKKGASVRAFFEMNKHPHGYRFVRLYDNLRGENLPTIGLSAGWVPATVAEEYNGTGDVLVKLHGSFDDPYSPEGGPVTDLVWRVHSDLVLERRLPAVTIDLSLVVVRWKDYWQYKVGSRTHNVLNEDLIKDVLDGHGSFKESFGTRGNYEVFTIFAKTSEHLNAIEMSDLSSCFRGRQKAALYFLWPTQKKVLEDNGMVAASALQALMQRMEAENIKTCWPHPAELYFDLVSKSWVARQCQHLDFKLPPTTLVKKEEFQPGEEASQAAAAIERLQELSRLRGQTPRSKEDYRGVVKLGYSWMGQAVIPFLGEASLKKALAKLLEGASPDAHCLVQERVEGVRCEMRAFCCQDLVNGNYAMKLVIMKMKAPHLQTWDATFCLTDYATMTPEELAVQSFAGDRSVVEAIQVEVRRLANLWLDWFQERHSPPQVIRLDFLISTPRKDAQPVPFQVHTCELTECGGSTCGLQVRPRTVAVVNRAAEAIEGFPKPLPPFAEERPQSQVDRSRLPERNRGRDGRDQVDRNKTEKETQLESHERRAPGLSWPISLFWVRIGQLWRFYGPCFKKVGNAHPLLYRSLEACFGFWVLRQRLQDRWARSD